MTIARALLLASALGLAGCAALPDGSVGVPAAGCDATLEAIDRAVGETGVADAGATRIEGFPGLRIDRFLATYAAGPADAAATREWVGRLAELGRRGHAIEIANLPPASRRALERELALGPPPALESSAGRCARELAERDLASPERIAVLRSRASVPDDYDTWKRIAGLYWITRIPFAHGVDRWHDEVREAFARPLEAIAAEGIRTAYAPPAGRLAPGEVAALLARTESAALRIPDPRGDDAEALYRTFAPTFVVGRASAADDPGEPGVVEGGVGLARRGAVVFRRMSHARLGDRALLQLEYWIWFDERPRASPWDALGGRLDAVLWRVTLAPDGEPWVYDAVHACGCYHLFFPTARAMQRPQPDSLDETAFVPQRLPRVAAGTPVEVWLEPATHYIRRIVPGGTASGTATYAFRDDDDLRSLPRPDGTSASLFGPDGIVAGSERLERWFFWPMGIREPGAMRQWGRHATAFVGRRHFDDPRLIPGYFDLH